MFRQRGYVVVAGVRNRARKLTHERQYGRAIVCDVSDAINVAQAIAAAQPQAVVHLAGDSHPWIAGEQPLTAYQSIVSGWANVLDGVRRVCPRSRVLLVSACDVYGQAGADGQPLTEDTPTQPTSTFGSFKLAAESIAHTYYEKFHLDLTVARPFHYTGPGQPESFFFGAAAKRLANWDPGADGDELSLPDLNCRRDVLHIQDVLDAYDKLLHEGKPNETYNVCSGTTHTCRELIETMIQTSQTAVRLVDQPAPASDDVPTAICGDATKLRQELDWKPTHTAQQAVQELVRSFQQAATPQTV
jgi:GDP-4-dehydro-6-deoxy-D-mannose reductase